MPRNGRDSPSAKLTIDEIVLHMADGWSLITGKGITHFGCWLRKGGEEKSVARCQYVLLRERGYIVMKGMDAPILLSERGKRRAASVTQQNILAGA